MKKNIAIILLLLVFISCNQNKSKPSSFVSETETEIDQDEFSDGEYCAEIDYYNPDTGTSSTYTLPVEVENGELIRIEWSNGGWLDSSHFSPPDISDGTASFDDDRGREFEVKLLEQGSCSGGRGYVEEEGIENVNEEEVNSDEEVVEEEE